MYATPDIARPVIPSRCELDTQQSTMDELTHRNRETLDQILAQHVTVSNLIILQVLKSFTDVMHRHLFDPGLDTLRACELQHLQAFRLVTDVTPAHQAAIGGEVKGMKLREGVVLVGKSDGHESAVDVQHRQEVAQRHLLAEHVTCRQQDVESLCVVLPELLMRHRLLDQQSRSKLHYRVHSPSV